MSLLDPVIRVGPIQPEGPWIPLLTFLIRERVVCPVVNRAQIGTDGEPASGDDET